MLFIVLVLFFFLLVFIFNIMIILLLVVVLVLVWVYLFMKCYIYLLQVVLGVVFGWLILMVFLVVSELLLLSCWLMFFVNILWVVVYDIQYVMVDCDDDVKIGIKLMVILFGENDCLIIGILQVVVLVLMGVVGWLNGLGWEYYWLLFVVVGLFGWQQKFIFNCDCDNCFKVFMNNNYVGLVLFFGLVMSYL